MGNSAIVLSGGGAKGSFQLGALDYLIRTHKVDPEVIVGVSTGNLNASMLAQGKGRRGILKQLADLKRIWFEIEDNDDIYFTRFGGVIGLLFKADSVYSNKPLWRKIQIVVDPTRLKTSGRVLRVGVVDLMSGDYRSVDGSDLSILEMIRASAAIPVLFNPVDVGSGRWVDGGVRNITPLGDAFDALSELDGSGDGPDTVYVILASPLQPKTIRDEKEMDSGIEILRRSLDLLMNEVYRNDLKLAATINESVLYQDRLVDAAQAAGFEVPGDFPFTGYRAANLVVIEPKVEHMGGLEFDPAKIRKAFNDGRAKAKKAVGVAAATGSNIRSADFKRG